MRMLHADSTCIESVGYEPLARELRVRFNTGRTCVYHGVARPVYEELLAAGSLGAYFNRHIRDQYPHERIG